MHTKIHSITVRLPHEERRRDPQGRLLKDDYSSQRLHEYRQVELEGTLTLEIDIEALMRWGRKALKAKGRKCRVANGDVRVIATKVTTKPLTEWAIPPWQAERLASQKATLV